ncbi:SEC59/DGK1/VTE5 family protein [soil metagenome]
MKRELLRKSIHLGTLAAPLLVWFLPRREGIVILGAAVLVAAAIEIARRRSRWFRLHFLKRSRSLLRGHERDGLAGATHLAIAYFFAFLLFPKPVAVLAMLYGGAGDAVAALVGKRWGRLRTSWGKSWEGAGAALVANVLMGLSIPGISIAPAIVGGIVAAGIEFLPIPVDDNLRVTLGGGAALWLAMAWL